ncbi:muscular LMNA-interacting protein isoform X2 [Seriola dumerili]|uniref:muscular LMNA-interacting protein isoform X2 n=1 Tax=Seriola dumerili TaxID=41447 RepID=UPI000BBEA86E|nr:muscular LMNA-interacting protein isoform X2 [Seriola dumerili]
MDSLNKSLGKVSIGVPSKPSFFTFVPVVHKLPFQSIISEEETSAALTGTPNKNVAVSHEKTTGETMSDGEIFKAEKVFIKDSLEGGAGNIIQPLTELQLKPSLDHVSLSHTEASPSVSAQSENTPNHAAAGTASMETAVDKHRGISQRQCHDTSGRAETHKIKLSYKSLAAIPTNTLLLDQQAIDEQVEREDSPCDTLDRDVEDTHAEMCSPAQLRQQSEELYAVIDEILANSIPATSRSSTPNAGVQQNNSTLPKSLGRETKYASLSSLYPSASMERKLMDPRKTKPGVIRPMTAIPRLTVEDEEEFYPNPFKQSVVKQTLTANKKEKVANMSPEEAGKDFFTSSKGKTMREERKPGRRSPFSLCDLQITEPEDLIGRPVKDAAASFSPSEGRMEAFETHI